MTKNFALALLATTTFASVAGCSDDTSSSATADPNLSQGYVKQCTRCHGPQGQGGGEYPRIPGTKADVAAYKAYVRVGKGEMPAFSATQISDADLEKDYTWLTTVRGK
jgi:mono/diheme cytochrome c family protein